MIPALVYGLVWRYCQMSAGVCRASHDTLAKHVGVSRHTIMRHLESLTNAGYLEDLTPDAKGKAHIYRDTGKAFAPVAESNNTCDIEQQQVLPNVTTPVTLSNTKRLETKGDNDTNGAKPPVEPVGKRARSSGLTEGQRKFLGLFGAKRFRNNTQRDRILELEQTYGIERLLELGHWAALRGMGVGQACGAVGSALAKQAGNGKPKVIDVGL